MIKAKLLPEWAPVRAVMLAWPYPKGDWQANYSQIEACYWDILEALSTRVEIWLLYHPSLDLNEFKSRLQSKGFDPQKVQVFPCEYDDTWIRDYGPLSTAAGYQKCRFNGWGGKYPSDNDNNAALHVLREQRLPVQSHDFVCEGGALETNGGVLLVNSNCVVDDLRNNGLNRDEVEQSLNLILGDLSMAWIDDICLTGDDTDGHIDTIVRFASSDTLLYAGRNAAHVDAQILESLHQQVNALAVHWGWKTVELPSPTYTSLLDGRVLPCTYANFLICNHSVFVPVYGLTEDKVALDRIASAFAGYEIVPVRCEALLEQHGSLHCATMQIAALS